MKFDSWLASALALGCLSIAACSDEDDEFLDDADYGYVGDEASVADYCAAVNYAFADPLDDADFSVSAGTVPPTTNDLAARSAAAIAAYFSPASCVTATSLGPVANVVLNQCDGPLGTQDISGTFQATFGQSSNGITLDVTATDVNIGGRTAQWTVDGAATRTPTGWNLSVNSSGTLQTLNGNTVNRTANAMISWVSGSGCVSVDGQSELAVSNGASYSTALSGYQRCTGSCPSAGTLTVNGPSQQITVSFDGSSSPDTSSTTGVEGELDLACDD
jgi:hypothetical protein